MAKNISSIQKNGKGENWFYDTGVGQTTKLDLI